jgi:DNA-binding FadR family transcriptional regulator
MQISDDQMNRLTSRRLLLRFTGLQSEILRFIIENDYKPGDKLPTIHSISKTMGISIAKMREELEIARALGVVDVKPGRGTRVVEYRFTPVATLSALYAIGQNSENFEHLRQLRDALESAFWEEAVGQLNPADIAALRALISSAHDRLASQSIQVPASEHRAFHLTIFSHLDNPFVIGIMEAFWEAYEAFGLNLYFELDYHHRVWDYHEQIVNAIEAGDVEGGRRLLVEHMNLLGRRNEGAAPPDSSIRFE